MLRRGWTFRKGQEIVFSSTGVSGSGLARKHRREREKYGSPTCLPDAQMAHNTLHNRQLSGSVPWESL